MTTPIRDPLALCDRCRYLNKWCVCEPQPAKPQVVTP